MTVMRKTAALMLWAALLNGLGACTEALPSGTEPTTLRTVRGFQAAALEALLSPLLDEEVEAPGRWADPSWSLTCADAVVTVDGAAVDVAAPVPDAFTVRWSMDRCTPLSPDFEVSGVVVLHVRSGPGGYVARVVPERLVVQSPKAIEVLTEPFSASLAVPRDAGAVHVARMSR